MPRQWNLLLLYLGLLGLGLAIWRHAVRTNDGKLLMTDPIQTEVHALRPARPATDRVQDVWVDCAVDLPPSQTIEHGFEIAARYRASVATAKNLDVGSVVRSNLQASLHIAGATIDPMSPRSVSHDGSAGWSVMAPKPGTYYGRLATTLINESASSTYEPDDDPAGRAGGHPSLSIGGQIYRIRLPSERTFSFVIAPAAGTATEYLSLTAGTIGVLGGLGGLLSFVWKWRDRQQLQSRRPDGDEPC
jgi:hypothetical protein